MFKIYFIGLMIISLLSSCGFKDDETVLGKNKSEIRIDRRDEINPNGDYDGDFISNKVELERGTNPKIANMPELRMKFLQNYKVLINYVDLRTKKEGLIEINPFRTPRDVDFKYRVGDLLIRKKAMENAAKFGRFSSHSYAEIYPQNLSWVRYPELSVNQRLEYGLKYSKYFDKADYKIKDIRIELMNEARLLENKGFESIKNLETSFYYFNTQKESNELLAVSKTKRHFSQGINEAFKVVLENVPEHLVRENFLKYGNFIFSEVTDYEIPSLGTTKKQLELSVKEKSLPLVLNTPNETKVVWIGLNGKKSRFSQVLDKAFGDKARVVKNEIESIYQFKSNLPNYTYLKEVEKLDKAGKWFIFTNELPTSYLDHEFTNKDVLTLSYIVGSTLAKQERRTSSSLNLDVKTSKEDTYKVLAQATKDSKITLKLIPLKKWGEIVSFSSESVNQPGGSCGRNRVCSPFNCKWKISNFKKYEQKLLFSKEVGEEMERISFFFGVYEYSLKELIELEVLDLSEKNGELLLTFSSLEKILKLSEGEWIHFAFHVTPKWRDSFNGIKLVSATGSASNSCFGLSTSYAVHNNVPLSTESLYFDRWQQYVDWNVVKRGEHKEFGEDFSFSASTIVTDFYN